MGKTFTIIIIFMLGFLLLNFMPISSDDELIVNNIYVFSDKKMANHRIIETVVSGQEVEYHNSSNISGDLKCNFSETIDEDIKKYNELMIGYAVRYADAANKEYNPPIKITGKALLGMAKQEKTPDPQYAVIWQGYWNTILQLKSKWTDIRYTDVDVKTAISGNYDGPLQIGMYYGRNNPAIKTDLGLVGTTVNNPRKERLNNSLMGDRFNALDSLNMSAGELARVMSSIPEGKCTEILYTCNDYAVVMLAAYAHNFGEGVFTHADNKESIAPYADFSKVSLYKFTKEVTESSEVRKIIEDEINKKGLSFSMYWNGESAQKILKYFIDNPIGDDKLDAWIVKSYKASYSNEQWYAQGISCGHRLFYGINAYANTLWLEMYSSGEITA